MSHEDLNDQQAQEAAAKARKDRNKLLAQQERADVKWLMGQPRGRRIIWRQLAKAGVFRTSFNTNAMQMAFNEGSKNAGYELLAMVNEVAPDKYLDMVKENTGE